MHHCADADGCKVLYLNFILLEDICAKVRIAGLEPEPDGLSGICPQAVYELVLPLVAALGDGHVGLIHQDRLDAG